MDNLLCWNCGTDVSAEPLPLSRQASCQACGEFLRCCRLCTQYAPGRPDDCDNDDAEPPTDKSTANFCEFFQPNANAYQAISGNIDARAKLDALFDDVGDTESEPRKPSSGSNPLDDLFND